ncbi:MAG TPA: glycosyltransferase [Pseudonocardiaceae bacterium]|jgi:UDP:flavonoid glycosyltransferase YjiC (YdhE family)
MLFAAAPGYGLTLPLIPLIWAARAAGHEVLLATTSEMTEVSARAGLPVYDVFPERDAWQDLMTTVSTRNPPADLPQEYRVAMGMGNPFGLFTVTMTEGTIRAGREFGADVVVYPSDHGTGMLAATALGVPALEVGNRVSWSTRDTAWQTDHHVFGEDEVSALMRTKLGIDADARPEVIARIDPRAPSMGGMADGVRDRDGQDGAPWWPMRFVPFNGGTVVPEWALTTPERPRVAVTLGTVVPAVAGVSSLKIVVDALGGLDVDVVLAAGTADLTELGELPANVRSVGFLPLSAFLASCAVLVHHGGSGTTAAALHYGIPHLVLPSFADNPLSAQRVVDRGVGLSHDPSTVDVETVREMVGRLLTEDAFGTAARQVSAEMATQPSPSAIVDQVLRWFRERSAAG